MSECTCCKLHARPAELKDKSEIDVDQLARDIETYWLKRWPNQSNHPMLHAWRDLSQWIVWDYLKKKKLEPEPKKELWKILQARYVEPIFCCNDDTWKKISEAAKDYFIGLVDYDELVDIIFTKHTEENFGKINARLLSKAVIDYLKGKLV